MKSFVLVLAAMNNESGILRVLLDTCFEIAYACGYEVFRK